MTARRPGWPKLSYRRLDDRTYELAVQASPRARRVPIGTVRRQGSLPSCTAWYGRGNWDGAGDSPRRYSRGDAAAEVWGAWRDRKTPAHPPA